MSQEIKLIDQINELGQDLYPDSWADKFGARWSATAYVSNARTGNIDELTVNELNRMLLNLQETHDCRHEVAIGADY